MPCDRSNPAYHVGPMAPLTSAYLTYLEGELGDKLEAIYKDDATPHGRAFEDTLQFTMQTYCQQHDQAGEQSAAFVLNLPCNNEFGIEGAVYGLMILRRTRTALAELLEDDADFLASYRGDHVTDAETDRSVRNDAREFEKRNEVGSEIDAIVKKTASEGEATEKEIIDASYGFQDGAQTEFNVALSARDRLEPVEKAPPAHAPPVRRNADTVPLAPPVSAGPSAITIEAKTYFGQTPSGVFNMAKKWLTGMIVKVASGSERANEFPRIRPLMHKPELEQRGTSQKELETLVEDIHDMADRLRPPLSEKFESLMDIALDLGRKKPDGSPMGTQEQIEAIHDALDSFTQMFGGRDDDKYGLGTEDWKKGGGGDDD